MARVYVLFQGEYSGRCVVGVFSSMEAAKRAWALVAGGDCDVENFEVDALVGAEYGPVWTASVEGESGRLRNARESYCRSLRHPTRCEVSECAGTITVRSPVSAEHADKVAVEKRQEWLRDRAAMPGGDDRCT